jgi:hypothetical protein
MIGEPETLELSEKMSVTVGVLDGWEQDLADGILCQLIEIGSADEPMPVLALAILQTKVYAVGSLRKINGVNVAPLRNKLAYSQAAQQLDLKEKRKLNDWADRMYNETTPVATSELKNVSGDQASNQLPA